MSQQAKRAKGALMPKASAQDERQYRYLELDNQLGVLLVSDAETDKAAAAMSVNVGHFSDPNQVLGLAHFLEHMLFLGTEKYPDENSYSNYLNTNGGSSNAFTSMEETNYYFDVKQDHLEPALDRFAQFFVAPLFTQTATDREMQAVHNENAKNLNNDSWRLFQLSKHFAQPDHVFHKFGTGNLSTLKEEPKKGGIDVRSQLLKFHETYYSSSIMRLVVLGREPLDTLQGWVQEKFSKVRNTGRTAPEFKGLPYAPASLQHVVRVVPVRDIRELVIEWQMPPVNHLYKSKPLRVLSHLLGHEAEGSVLSALKRRGWATALSSGQSHSQSCFSGLTCAVDLTESGLENWQHVLDLVYQYVGLMQSATPQQWEQILAEKRDIGAMNFLYKSKETPIGYASSLASSLLKVAPEDVLASGYLLEEPNVGLVRSFLQYVKPEHMLVTLISKSFEGQLHPVLVEPWYSTKYDVAPLPRPLLHNWVNPRPSAELHLPRPNEFIATDFALRTRRADRKEDETKFPIKLYENPGVVCWFKLDQTFKKPKVNLRADLVSAHAYSTPAAAVCTDLYSRLVDDALTEFSYNADLAGLSYNIGTTKQGLRLTLAGYNHKLPVLLQRILERMRHLAVQPDRFAVYKDELLREYKNFDKEQPYQHAMYHYSMSMESVRWHVREKLVAADGVTPDDVQHHVKLLFDDLFAELLIHGNMSEEEALALVDMLQSTMKSRPLPPSHRPDSRVVELAPATEYAHSTPVANPSDPNSAVQVSFQIGPSTIQRSARAELLQHLMQEPCFNQLRTNEQLGYIVYTSLFDTAGVLDLRILVQSSERDAEYLEGRVEAFLHHYGQRLAEMPADEFKQNLEAMIAKKLEKDKNLREETGRLWTEIVTHKYLFNRRQLEVEELRKITQADIVAFFRAVAGLNCATRRKFVTHVQALPKDPAAVAAAKSAPPDGMDVELAQPQAAPQDVLASETPEAADAIANAEKEAAELAAKNAKLVPPAPASTLRRVVVEDFAIFKRGMPLYPQCN